MELVTHSCRLFVLMVREGAAHLFLAHNYSLGVLLKGGEIGIFRVAGQGSVVRRDGLKTRENSRKNGW